MSRRLIPKSRGSLPSGFTSHSSHHPRHEFRLERKLIRSPRGDQNGTASATRGSNSRVIGRIAPSAIRAAHTLE